MLLLAAVAAVLSQGGPYDADPKHPWNELHQAMFTWRPAPPVSIPGGLETDPLFWPIGTEPWTFSAALLPVLDRIAGLGNDKLLKDPLKRAMVQHDLWMFFDSLDGQFQGGGWSIAPEDGVARDGARRRIGRLMRRLALTPEEIRAFPDNFAAAVASRRHPAAFDPARPEHPFLPADLPDPKGPWVLLGREDGMPAAEQHVKHFRGRSAFLVYASIPGGREVTVEYFRGLGVLNKANLPDVSPAGTRFLLVRRPFLLDPDGQPHLSPLTEEVRLRISVKGPEPDARAFEFHLNRADLFSGVAGGLRAAAPMEEAVLFFFHRGTSKTSILASCRECHGAKTFPASGLRHAGVDRQSRQALVTGIPLRAATVDQEAETTLKWKQADKSWSTLRQFWPKE